MKTLADYKSYAVSLGNSIRQTKDMTFRRELIRAKIYANKRIKKIESKVLVKKGEL